MSKKEENTIYTTVAKKRTGLKRVTATAHFIDKQSMVGCSAVMSTDEILISSRSVESFVFDSVSNK